MQVKTRILGQQRTRHCTSRPVRARLPPFCELFFLLCPALALLIHATFLVLAWSYIFPAVSTTEERFELVAEAAKMFFLMFAEIHGREV